MQPLQKIFSTADYPDLLIGLEKADDAAVYRVNDKQAIVTSTDFFPPVVDDPYDFGAIAAANALSDIYAMGGEVLFAINLVAFPDNLVGEVLREVLRGGAEKVAEAGGVIAGGHSVNDKEPKYGLAVTGIIDPAKVMKKGGARDGDLLILTKSLGTGVITTALKQEKARDEDVKTAVVSMTTLNRQAAHAAARANAHSMTDITGFGLLGHAHEMAEQAQADFHFDLNTLPWLPGTVEYAQAGTFPGGMGNNLHFFAPVVRFGDGVSQLYQDMLFTPETSGGLLVAVAPEMAGLFMEKMAGQTAVVIGHVTGGSGLIIVE